MWTKEKPELTKECILVTSQYFERYKTFETTAFDIYRVYDPQSQKHYFAVFENGDLWGDYSDLEADYYMILEYPELT